MVITGRRAKCGCLWKKGEPNLSNNYTYARRRWETFEKSKFMATPSLKATFDAEVRNWLNDIYVREVPLKERRPARAYYLPIFAVVRMDKSSSQVRIDRKS